MNLGPYRDDPSADNIWAAAFFPIIFVLCFMFYPDTSRSAVLFGSIFLGIMGVLLLLTRLKKWQYYLGWRLGIAVLYVDSALLFFALTITRGYGNSIPAVTLIGLQVIVIILSHIYVDIILGELEKPKTRIGKAIVWIGMAGSGMGAIIGYLASKSVGVQLIGPILFIISLIVVAIVHATFHRAVSKKG